MSKHIKFLGLCGLILLVMALMSISVAAQEELTPVRLQLQWVAQSQFGGYYAAVDQGFYEEEGLDVTILEGAVEIVPQQVVASGGAEFGIAWVPKVLESRQAGCGHHQHRAGVPAQRDTRSLLRRDRNRKR